MQVSHETIYRSLFIQSRGVLKRALLSQLRRQRHFRHARAGATVRPKQGQIIDVISIRQRPAEVADRALPGHWEGDLLEGARGTYIATLVERQSRRRSTCTFATRRVLGTAALTKTRMDCCGSTCLMAPTCRPILKPNSTPSPTA